MTSQPVKLFVAAYTQTYAIVVFTDSDDVATEIGIESPIVCDLMGGQEPPSDGLWMFEGTATWSAVDAEEGVRFDGEWRRPTEAEALAAATGENPCLIPC